MSKGIHHSFLAALLVAGLCFASVARADAPVTLQPMNEVNRPTIKLSDVFAGLPEASDRDIATAPLPGKSVVYDVRVLSKLAAQYRLDWQAQSMADRAVLTRAATKISQDMIREAVALKLKAEKLKGKAEIQFDNRTLEVNLPADQQPVFTLDNFDYDASSRRFRANLNAKNGVSPVVIPVMGRVSIKRDVPVLSRNLEAGVAIGEADLDWISIPDDRVTGDVVTEAAQIVGRELRHPVPEGQILHSRDVIPPRFVTRGSLVTLKIETPFMLMTAQGRALQDGVAGDVVRVTNTQSNRVIEGVAEAPGVVRIRTTRQVASAE